MRASHPGNGVALGGYSPSLFNGTNGKSPSVAMSELGIMHVLIQSRNFRRYLAKFAALIAILALVTDPFTQRMVHYVNCTRNSTSLQGDIARTNFYQGSGPDGVPESYAAPRVAITTGLVDPPEIASSLVHAKCASGNCTYGLFSTLGVCHKCTDISDQLQTHPDFDQANFSLPVGSIWIGLDIMGEVQVLQTATQPRSNSNPAIGQVFILMSSGELDPKDYDNKFNNAVAFDCSIFACVRTYNASMVNLVLNEVLLSTTPIGFSYVSYEVDNIADSDSLGLRLATSQVLRNGSWEPCISNPNYSPGLVEVAGENVDAAPTHWPPPPPSDRILESRWYSFDCVWGFGSEARKATSDEFRSVFAGVQLDQYHHTAVYQVIANRIWKPHPVDKIMGDLADTISARIRNDNEYPHSLGLGTMAIRYTCV